MAYHHFSPFDDGYLEGVSVGSKLLVAMEQLYYPAIAFSKLSILASYLRIFASKSYRIITYVVIGIVSATAVSGVVASFTVCRPFSSRWEMYLPEYFGNYQCFHTARYYQGISVPNIATDVVMLVLPLPVVWGLNVSRNQKLALSFVFLLGSMYVLHCFSPYIITV